MAHLRIIWGLGLVISTVINAPVMGDPVPSVPVIRATLDGNYAYTSGVSGRVTGVYRVDGGGMLSILRQDVQGDKKVTVLDHHRAIGGGSTALLRWQQI